jgi:uncharacterized repeat protein (TIGR03803 family)
MQGKKFSATPWAALILVLASTIFIAQSAYAQTYSVLHTFTGDPDDGANPVGSLFLTESGSLYGTTTRGGLFPIGTVFRLNASGRYKVHSIPDTQFYGGNPEGGLVRDGSGNLFGTTAYGTFPNQVSGTVFRMDRFGIITYLHEFSGEDGAHPIATLARDHAGNLYGITELGGDLTCHPSYGCGVVFRVDNAGNYSVLHEFEETDGSDPVGGLVLDEAGNLYGTTPGGGDNGCGTIYKLASDGNLTVLHNFGGDGCRPFGNLVRDAKGNLYGTTFYGGEFGVGTIFKLSTTSKYIVRYSFTGGTEGSYPEAGVVRDKAGNLYGTTSSGGDLACSVAGSTGCGIVFKLDTTGTLTVLHTFEATDGSYPKGGVVRDLGGNLYGTTYWGGDLACLPPLGCGVVYKIAP